MKIFITDDDEMLRMVLADYLQEPGRTFRDFENGEALLAAANEEADLILLDIDMPGMGGIAACRAWREKVGDETQIMFISSNDDLPTRLTAYDAGANDYIIKPVDASELRRKVKVAEALTKHKQELAEQAKIAGQTAFAAMSTIGEMGIIHQFMHTSFSSTSAEHLAEAVIGALKRYELPALVTLRADFIPGGELHASTSDEPLSQLELSLLGHAATMERIFQFRNRLVVNDPTITILVNKLPLDDPDRIGRLKDHLAIIAEGTSTRLKAIGIESEKEAQNQEVLEVLSTFVKTLEQIQDNQVKSSDQVRGINEALLHDLIDAFVSLGLTDKQESMLIDIAEKAQANLEALRARENTLNQQLLNRVADSLHKLLGQEETMTFF